jgi:peptidoglycan/LPS O-acetylase OafA/YrhL
LINKIYFENLDGLRAIAAIAVMLTHISSWIPSEGKFYTDLKRIISFNNNGGNYGVIFFFILSGFLISYLLFLEKATNNKVNLRMFYIRRILRIWPLYYLTIFIGFFIYPIYDPSQLITASKVYYGLFLANFDHIYNGSPGIGILGVHWSVAVEEQFYLFWPLIFFIKNDKIKVVVFLTLVILSQIFYSNQTEWSSAKYHFFSCIRYLGSGAVIGYISYFYNQKIKWFFTKFPRIFTLVIYVTCVLFLFFSRQLNQIHGVFDRISEFLPIIFFSLVIMDQNYNSASFIQIGKFKILNWLGKISYGIYLIHMIAISIVNALFFQYGSNFFMLKFLISILITILLSQISYLYFEKYFLNLKDRIINAK